MHTCGAPFAGDNVSAPTRPDHASAATTTADATPHVIATDRYGAVYVALGNATPLRSTFVSVSDCTA